MRFLLTDPVFRGRMVLDNLLSFACCKGPASVAVHGEGPTSDPVRNILFHAIPSGGLEVRRRIREVMELEHGEEANRVAAETELYLRKDDLVELGKSGVTIARHTASHVNLKLLDDVNLEVKEEWNACGLDSNMTVFSFPFGGLADAEEAIPMLSSSGMNPCFLVEGCSNQSRRNVCYRTSPKADGISCLNADLEVFSLIRRMLKKSRVEAVENLAREK